MAEVYSFAATIATWVDKTKENNDKAVRAYGMQILGRLIEISPVGDPRRWKINKAYALAREHANKVNAAQRRKNGGKLKRGQKKHASVLVSFKTKNGNVTFRQRGWAAKNYTGGRFRGNWQVTFDRPAVGAIDRVDKAGTATLAAGREVLAHYDSGEYGSIWFTNNVPYAQRLEYGWSKQAPAGIVRVVAAEINSKVK
ncbi:putative tail protein [Escherichia phage bob]|uniref:Gp12 n=2 Tax=Dhillonvirus TaxID=1623289 RepID=C9EHA2_9CAUD|nr:tail completion or Neck1 protein [Sodalis phage SO1]YP_010741520.1 putative tail protein [Escherichia phage bob]ACV84104.1 gp12 [Sodalis phage SO1]QHZ59636.1 putative tail protein [Escherichia phage bob]